MKTFALRIALTAAFASLAAAETWTGDVVDVMCKGRDLITG